MRLDINKKLAIISDEMEYCVIEKKEVKSGDNAGKPLEVPIAHCSSLNYAFKFIVDNTVKTSKAINDLGQVLDEANQIKEEIDEVLKPLKYKEER